MALRNKILLFVSLSTINCLCFSAPRPKKLIPSSSLKLFSTGDSFPIDYTRYGEFIDRGTGRYKYKITDRPGLAAAMGEGIYPNVTDLQSNPGYVAWKKKNPGKLSPWDFVNSGDPTAEFYAWAQDKTVGPGTRLFFLAQALNEGGHYKQALKAYYAILVNFPKEACWSTDHSFVWYLSEATLDHIENILHAHPDVAYELNGAVFKVTNGRDTDLTNDEFILDPGQWAPVKKGKGVDLSTLKIKDRRGDGRVQLVQFQNGHWQLRVDNQPFAVHGMTYSPTEVGKRLADVANQWMSDDTDDDGLVDAPYQSWIDKNKNNKKDADEPEVGDFQLMKDMGVNAIRFYQNSVNPDYNPKEFNKKTLRDMQERYGIYAIMGHFLGAYTISSGATWEEGTDYTDPVQRENMKNSLHDYVLDHRHEPYVLMWLLGNENLMPADYSGINATRTNAASHVKEYLQFVNEMAEMIHQLDPDHPVAVGNLDAVNLEEYAQYAPAVDIFGANSYHGVAGFGALFKRVHQVFDRPVLITEYGCDAYDSRTHQENEAAQADYHEGNWQSIQTNLAGGAREGNAIGGVIFEYLDEWWKSQSGSAKVHDVNPDFPMDFPDGWAQEEWFGVMSQGNGSQSPLLRQPRQTYYLYRDKLWKN